MSYEYAMLFGESKVYIHSGYFNIENEIKYVDYKSKEIKARKKY